ncbi:MAG: hypothetical protein ACXVDI_07045 [Ktedonobacterales bacterium]
MHDLMDRAYGWIAGKDLHQVIPLPLSELLGGFGKQDSALSGSERGRRRHVRTALALDST